MFLGHGTVPFDRVAAFRDGAGRTASGRSLDLLVQARRLPSLTQIRLTRPPLVVAADDVRHVVLPGSGAGRRRAFLIGLAVDVVVLVVVVIATTDLSVGLPPPDSSSCPFVLTDDGSIWRREAEMVGSATFRGAEHTDRARVEHLAPLEGEYRIRLANELHEIDHVDSVRLLAADLPSGVRAVPSPSAELLAVGRLQAPRRAVDRDGRDVTPDLAAPDGRLWLGRPLGRDPARPEDLRDGAVLQFARGPGARAATLVFTARSTSWAVRRLSQLLSLQGRELDAWRERVSDDSGARDAFLGAMAREGLPRISVWDGRSWRPAGVLRNLGPRVSREQALRVPVSDAAGETLRVAIDVPPGLWAFDAVGADFSDRPEVAPRALPLLRATSPGGDAVADLGRIDARRRTLRRGDVVDLAFEAPAPGTRSLVVELTGYYTPLLDGRGAAQADRFAHLIAEPGALSRWNLRRLEDELGRAVARSRDATAVP